MYIRPHLALRIAYTQNNLRTYGAEPASLKLVQTLRDERRT
jgi:hypothetical protein